MKLQNLAENLDIVPVAPLAGAWIEISAILRPAPATYVAPLAGAWIEIMLWIFCPRFVHVAPLAGAWIEMIMVL